MVERKGYLDPLVFEQKHGGCCVHPSSFTALPAKIMPKVWLSSAKGSRQSYACLGSHALARGIVPHSFCPPPTVCLEAKEHAQSKKNGATKHRRSWIPKLISWQANGFETNPVLGACVKKSQRTLHSGNLLSFSFFLGGELGNSNLTPATPLPCSSMEACRSSRTFCLKTPTEANLGGPSEDTPV